jgi:menaquinone-dependent protoporphyrinogen oxidase
VTSTHAHPDRPVPGLPDHRREGPASRVLVAFASRHGATRELAAGIAHELVRAAAGRGADLTTFLAPVQRHPDAMRFDAVVLGSPVYDGRWLEPALSWVGDMAGELRERPVWLFSGGAPTLPSAGRRAGDGRWVADALGAREHRFLGGRVESRLLSAAERSVWPGVGDSRDWQALRDWCARIAAEVVERPILFAAR